MENDLISRSALLAKRCKLTGLVDAAGMKHGAVAIPLDVVKNAPAIDPRTMIPHGKRRPHYVTFYTSDGEPVVTHQIGYECPFCKSPDVRNFCANCGAKMDKEE